MPEPTRPADPTTAADAPADAEPYPPATLTRGEAGHDPGRPPAGWTPPAVAPSGFCLFAVGTGPAPWAGLWLDPVRGIGAALDAAGDLVWTPALVWGPPPSECHGSN